MAKRASSKRASSTGGAKRGSSKRTAVKNRAGSFYAKRKAGGQFKELDEKARSLWSDRKRHAKRRVKPGYGDQGDRKPRGGSRGKSGGRTSR